MKRKLLFLCTGNFYRSRFAEEYFNHLAHQKKLQWLASSKGLSNNMPNPENPGAISIHAVKALKKRNGSGKSLDRYLKQVDANDFASVDKIVALCEAEHYPMIQRRFNGFLRNVTFFEIGDLPEEEPDKAMDRLAIHVEQLVKQLK